MSDWHSRWAENVAAIEAARADEAARLRQIQIQRRRSRGTIRNLLRLLWAAPLGLKLLLGFAALAFAIPFPYEAGVALGFVLGALVLGLLVTFPLTVGLYATGLYSQWREAFGLGWGFVLVATLALGSIWATTSFDEAEDSLAFTLVLGFAWAFGIIAVGVWVLVLRRNRRSRG